MRWEGEYKVKCPKCGCRNIWVTEVIEASSEHFIKNGVWDHDYDNNELGNGIRVDCRCDECSHQWSKPMTSIDWFTDECKEQRKENRLNRKIKENNELYKLIKKYE